MRSAVYITRAQHWPFESRERSLIFKSEWLAYVQSDSELKLVKFMEGEVEGTRQIVRVAVADTYEWIAHPTRTGRRVPATFEYNRGGIIVRAPDPDVLRKAAQVAAALGARVIGDDDVILGEGGAI